MNVVRRALGQETASKNFVAALATPSRGATETSVIRHRQSPGGQSAPHSHDHEETMVMLMGRVTVVVAGEQIGLGSGDTLIVPARTLHHVRNAGSVEAEWLLISPPGTRSFDEAGDELRPAWAQ